MDINSLLQNNTLLQYMSGLGASIGGKDSPAAAMDRITQQQIGAQSKVKMQNKYAGMLGGGNDVLKQLISSIGPKSKIKIDANGITSTMPPEAVAYGGTDSLEILKAMHDTGLPASTEPGTQPQQTGSPIDNNALLLQAMLNPPVKQLQVNPSDMAGLGSADVSQALHDAAGVDAISRNTNKDMISTLMSMNQTVKPYPVPIPGMGYVDPVTWAKLPDDAKSYATYAYMQKLTSPDKPIMTQHEWKFVDKNEKLNFLKDLSDPKNADALAMQLKLNESGRASNSTVVHNYQQESFDKAKGNKRGSVAGDIESGDFLPSVQADLQKDEATWYSPPRERVDHFNELYKNKGKAIKAAQEEMVINRAFNIVKGQYPNDKVIMKPDGIYVNGTKKVVF